MNVEKAREICKYLNTLDSEYLELWNKKVTLESQLEPVVKRLKEITEAQQQQIKELESL